jgi:hypothetical protein
LLWDIELAVDPAASPDQGAPVRAGAW